MTRPADQQRGSDDLLFLLAVVLLGTASGGHWLIGNVAALLGRGRLLHAGVPDAMAALVRLPEHWGDPRHAWSEPAASNLPGPVIYWASAAVVVVAAVGGTALAMNLVSRRRHQPVDQRQRLGIDTQPRLAGRKDLRGLLVRQPEPGRLVLARWGRRYLATEAGKCGRRRGVRGAVAVMGPSESGKTTGLVAGLAAWDGPAIVSSVKADLLRASLDARSAAGDVKVFDPLGITKMEKARWSPLRAARDLKGALAAAQMLARAGGDEGPHDRFWRGQAEQLIAGMLWTAANTDGQSMRNVVKWVLDLDRPAGDDNGTLAPLVWLLTDHADPEVALAARQVQGWLHGQWKTDSRTTSSVYATARNAVWPWADPDVAASAEGCDVTLDWLLESRNTLYLCAPLGDETRIGAVFAVLLHDLVTQAFDRYNRQGEPLEPRLLVLLDEAANTPLPKLPQWASTVTGAGMQLVTVWQSKAQLDQIYGRDADDVLTNHRTKLVYPSGLSDMATIEYVSALVGREHVRGDLESTAGIEPASVHRPGSLRLQSRSCRPACSARWRSATRCFSTASCPQHGSGLQPVDSKQGGSWGRVHRLNHEVAGHGDEIIVITSSLEPWRPWATSVPQPSGHSAEPTLKAGSFRLERVRRRSQHLAREPGGTCRGGLWQPRDALVSETGRSRRITPRPV